MRPLMNHLRLKSPLARLALGFLACPNRITPKGPRADWCCPRGNASRSRLSPSPSVAVCRGGDKAARRYSGV